MTTNNPDYTYSMLDAFVPLPGDDEAQCKCKRGPRVSIIHFHKTKVNGFNV